MSKLKITGALAQSLELQFADLAGMAEQYQIRDVSQIDPKRQGDAVSLAGLIALAQLQPTAKYLGLHASRDDFHASIPLEPIRERGFLIYRLHGQPLGTSAGGPFRFYIPNHHACHTDEIDECANVKYVDHLEFTESKGFDNRPHDETEHAQLHAKE